MDPKEAPPSLKECKRGKEPLDLYLSVQLVERETINGELWCLPVTNYSVYEDEEVYRTVKAHEIIGMEGSIE
eukprot:scaffold63462_cov71-Attheya_sp.AAC.1